MDLVSKQKLTCTSWGGVSGETEQTCEAHKDWKLLAGRSACPEDHGSPQKVWESDGYLENCSGVRKSRLVFGAPVSILSIVSLFS